ncbi:bifunctional UDP-N-acetylglucosamine pyrophosphorylase/glucosamine-1-phosphate N-acetyltransferase [Litorivivens lipolytica]|uniref:Bifunctional protein GlmU n=1 Tax=Litorivivens lipolytica TaxID=1524264 RepID=A0A7W4W726_9GAMM|nr:bifunctional UDP-N-acetylglucosamine pyrophosphorylase/glucosamine-1-phosphate N-acetyltransferase [Litorivivens lipolytica]
MKTDVVILAAGKGTRMRSSLPKVMHPIAGKSMLGHVVAAAEGIGADNIHVVVGHGAETVKAAFDGHSFVEQLEQKGTGHAVAQALPKLDDDSCALILYGDVPLIAPETLQQLVAQCSKTSMGLLTTNLNDPTGYGRIIREHDKVVAIVEQKDASPEQLAIQEVNTGIMAVHSSHLKQWLPKLSSDNAQGEYYLTDIIEMAVADNITIEVSQPKTPWEVQGVNNRMQLNELERYYQRCRADEVMADGATLADASRIDIRGSLKVGQDCYIDVNCVFEGECEIGDGVEIGPNCVLTNSKVANGSTIKANSVLEDAVVGEQCDIGPFARLRPGTVLAAKAKIGNFVETKKAVLGEGSKVNHLSYIGDSEIGEQVNVGAGTITCNYDGVNKSKTVIGDGAFIGSNTSLVAPVTVGKNATVGAGSTITGNVGDEELAVARGKQRNISGWKRPSKKN